MTTHRLFTNHENYYFTCCASLIKLTQSLQPSSNSHGSNGRDRTATFTGMTFSPKSPISKKALI